MKIRKHLSADSLFKIVKQEFKKIKDHRPINVEIPWEDAWMSGFALFSLKAPSLLAFDEKRQTPDNLNRVYGLNRIPSDTQMRTLLDNVHSEGIRPLFKGVLQQLQRGKELEKMRYMGKNDVPLNESNADVRVNFLEYWEIKSGKTQHFSWITEFTITDKNAFDLMRGGVPGGKSKMKHSIPSRTKGIILNTTLDTDNNIWIQ